MSVLLSYGSISRAPSAIDNPQVTARAVGDAFAALDAELARIARQLARQTSC